MPYTTTSQQPVHNSGYIEDTDAFTRDGIIPSAGIRDYALCFDTLNGANPLVSFRFPTGNKLYQMTCLYIYKGEYRLNINGSVETLTEGMMITTMPDSVINPIYVSPDISYFMLVIYPKVVIETFKDLGMTYSTTKAAQRYFVSEIPDDQKPRLLSIYQEIKHDMLAPAYEYKEVYLRSLLNALFVENMNIHKHDLIQQEDGDCNSRQYDIYCRFLAALNKHSQEHRTVHYYANLLDISSKYLSFVCVSYSKKNASTWIDESVVKKAIVYMVVHNYTLNQISDLLNFQTISSFSRFFKRVTGETPKEYLRTHKNKETTTDSVAINDN